MSYDYCYEELLIFMSTYNYDKSALIMHYRLEIHTVVKLCQIKPKGRLFWAGRRHETTQKLKTTV